MHDTTVLYLRLSTCTQNRSLPIIRYVSYLIYTHIINFNVQQRKHSILYDASVF